MLTRTIKGVFTEKHKEYIARCETATMSVAEGAVRAGKTIDNVLAFAKELAAGTPDRIHLATGSTVANAKLNIGDCNGFGLEYIFRGRCRWSKYKDNEALRIKLNNREYIVIFCGGSKSDSFKKIRGNSFGMWIATEINLHHQSTIQEAFNRQLAAKNRKVFWDLNPSAPGAWIYTNYIDRFAEQFKEKYNYEHFVIEDNATISPERLAEIKAQYEPGSIWYKRDILGERCNAEGIIFDMFSREKNVLTKLPKLAGSYYVSCDYGTQNPTCFLLWRREDKKRRWICEKEYYYGGRANKKQKTDKEYADDLQSWLGEISPRAVVVDPAAASFIAELRSRGIRVQRADNDVVDGIRKTADRLRDGTVLFSATCVNLLEEIQGYIWDEKAADAGIDRPLKVNDHAMDAMRYFVSTILGRQVVSSKRRPAGL